MRNPRRLAASLVCSHLSGDSVGLGFNESRPPTPDNPFPDAWCDDCELIRAGYDGWNEISEKLVKIVVICSRCYERSRIRNAHTSITFDDLTNLRWKCSSCEEWHTGPCLDFSYPSPYYWRKEYEESGRRDELAPNWNQPASDTFQSEDYCAIENRDFFVRGLVHLPIIGTAETFRWGVWGSLSRENYETLLEMEEDPKRSKLPPMFCWLSTQISDYPDTLSLKMYARVQESGFRPIFELELADHPLSREYHKGISPQRVKELMMTRLRDFDSGA